MVQKSMCVAASTPSVASQNITQQGIFNEYEHTAAEYEIALQDSAFCFERFAVRCGYRQVG